MPCSSFCHTQLLFIHTKTHTLAVCVYVWWSVMISSDLKLDRDGVVGVGSKVVVLQWSNPSSPLLQSWPPGWPEPFEKLFTCMRSTYCGYINTLLTEYLTHVCIWTKRGLLKCLKCNTWSGVDFDVGIQWMKVGLATRQQERQNSPPYAT